MNTTKRLWDVYAVVDSKPIDRINLRGLNRDQAQKKADAIHGKGNCAKAYAVKRS